MDSGPAIYPVKAAPLWPAAGWEVEGGGRYFGSWGQFQKNFRPLNNFRAAKPTERIPAHL
jgi:hypothetical protein